MSESLTMKAVFKSTAEKAYKAWLDSKEHSKFTGGKAIVSDVLNGEFSAWDGYITGANIMLSPYEKIVQSWRTSDFPDESPDSKLEILFKDTENGVEITLNHTEIPDGQGKDYEDGWNDYYFEPMKDYFNKKHKSDK